NNGPILPPEFQGFAVTAIAPHLSWFRPLLLQREHDLRLTATGTGGILLTIDGQSDVPIRPNQHLHVGVAKCHALFARTSDTTAFFTSLRTRLAGRS
ncbi:MAG: hypothetical protein M1118_08465, partial [Chloroflexi bacterium]|nr:hypothetical protein [Chloroflexota bacterium]